MSARLHISQHSDALSAKAADLFCKLAAEAIGRNGRFTVALSGGSTPRRLYELLASDEFRGRVDWDSVECFFGDERCVPPDHKDSNFRMADEALLSHVPAVVHRIRGEDAPEEAASRYEEELRGAFGPEGFPSFDLVLLGLGVDGHIASLFPDSDALSEKKRLAVPTRSEAHGHWRVTLTLPVINAAHQVAFLVSGGEKTSIMRSIFLKDKKGASYPAALVRPVNGDVLWLIDEEASKGLFRQSE